MHKKIIDILRMIKFSHSLFALPFAMGVYLVYADLRRPTVLLLLIIAMVSARSAAMAFNRLADRRIDAKNPRTKGRELPRKKLTVPFVTMFTVFAAAVFLIAAAFLSPLAFLLAPIALIILLGYSYTKRFTFLSHYVLGLSLALAPAGVMIAVTNGVDLRILPLIAAVTAWVAGFDIIYSLADTAFDRKYKLHSIPADLGTGAAQVTAAASHGVFIIMLMLYGIFMHFGPFYWSAIGIIILVLVSGYIRTARRKFKDDGFFFFTVNVIVSVSFFAGMAAERLAHFR